VLSTRELLAPYPPTMAASLVEWAKRVPEHVALADRKGEPRNWRLPTYGVLTEQSQNLARSLQALGLWPERPGILISHDQIEAAIAHFGRFPCGCSVIDLSNVIDSRAS
jgi:acyl-CoA synthetase (AMP-forming)/AMP-acid ligase II